MRFQDLTHLSGTLTGGEKIPIYTGGVEDFFITPNDIGLYAIPPEQWTGTTNVFVLADAFKVKETMSANSTTVQVPSDSTVNFQIGTVLQVAQIGAGRVTYSGGSGVVIRWPKAADGTTDCKLSRAQNSEVAFRKRAANDWVAAGDLSAT